MPDLIRYPAFIWIPAYARMTIVSVSICHINSMEKQMIKNIPDMGQDVPDFEAMTSDNNIFKLSEELKSGQNVKLMFYRGHW